MDRVQHIIINHSENLDRLFRDIRNIKPMTIDEENDIFTKIAEGDEKARNTAIERNMRFVIARAKVYTGNTNTLDDLIQEGMLGLMDALNRYDLSRGFRFISFAVYYIDLYMRQFLFGNAIVRQSNDRKIAPKVRQIRSRFLELNEREATEWEIAEILESEYGIEVKDTRDLLPVAVSYLDASVSTEENCTALDCGEIATRTASDNIFEGETEREQNNLRVRRLMQKLTPKEREIVDLAFGITSGTPLDNEIIAERYGCCAERIRQIVKGATRKMAA